MKKLPNLYKNNSKIPNKNQKEVNITASKVEIEKLDKEEYDVNKKIDDIFSSPRYVYKAEVNIELIDGKNIKKTIIGRTNNSLITIDDELINVNKISKIDFI